LAPVPVRLLLEEFDGCRFQCDILNQAARLVPSVAWVHVNHARLLSFIEELEKIGVLTDPVCRHDSQLRLVMLMLPYLAEKLENASLVDGLTRNVFSFNCDTILQARTAPRVVHHHRAGPPASGPNLPPLLMSHTPAILIWLGFV
jgi:hypothetical protein